MYRLFISLYHWFLLKSPMNFSAIIEIAYQSASFALI